MRWTTMLAIYFLLWFISLFLVLPFGVRTSEEEGKDLVPGQVESAPAQFKALRIFGTTSLVAAAFFALFYANYVNEWVTTATFHAMMGPRANISN